MRLNIRARVALSFIACGAMFFCAGSYAAPVQKEGTANAKAPMPDAHPFGLSEGISTAKLKELVPDADCTDMQCSFKKAPRGLGHEFEYTAHFGADVGLCQLVALKTIDDASRYGNDVRSAFNELKGALQRKYGNPSSSYDYLMRGSIWNEPRDWMMGLAKKERTLAAFWEAKVNRANKKTRSPSVPLPANLAGISIRASGVSMSTAFIVLRYSFSNIDECAQDRKKAESSAL